MDAKTNSDSLPTATLAPMEANSSGNAPSDGNRACSCKMFSLYLFSVFVGIAGVIVMVSSPKECRNGFEEEDCNSCVDGCQTYDCTRYDDDGKTCTDKRISTGAIAGGVILLITMVALLISSCCFQCRCCCKTAKF
jgi:hypothetical protein